MFATKQKTFLKGKDTTKALMRRVLIALVPIILFAWIKNGIYPALSKSYKVTLYDLVKPLIIILTPCIITCLIEGIYYRYIKKVSSFKKAIKEHYSILPGLFLGLILPINTPLYIVIIGAIFTTVVGKLIFGGFSNNIFNPALLGRLFIIFCFGSTIGSYNSVVDTVSSATPLSILSTNSYMIPNDYPYSLLDLFIGFKPGCLGEVSSLLCLISFIYLTFTKTIKYRITLSYIGSVFLITLIAGLFGGQDIAYPLYHIFTGGLMFGAVFMATDPITSPVGKYNQYIYGLCLGLLTCFIRFFTSYPEGVLTSILIMNLFVSLINNMTILIPIIKKAIIIGGIILSSVLIYFITDKLTPVQNLSNNMIVQRIEQGNKVDYVLENKGFSSNIKLNLTIDNDYITYIEVVSENDSYYNLIENDDYLNKFKTNISNISGVDTVASATITSNSIKKMVTSAVTDYKNTKGGIYE